MPTLNSRNRLRQFETDTNGVISDATTRWGIVTLGICLIALIIFFFWYNNRSLNAVPTDEKATGGFFSRVFSSGDKAAAAIPDADADGLDDASEKAAGTDSLKPDTDGDALSDREELRVYKTDPLKSDSDGDGMNDGDEIKNRRDPLNQNPQAVWPPAPSADQLKS